MQHLEVGDARLHLGTAVQVIEELMSIADGQVVLQRDAATGMVSVDPQASISRIGSRAYSPALADLAVQLRFELAQVGWPLQRLPCSAACLADHTCTWPGLPLQLLPPWGS